MAKRKITARAVLNDLNAGLDDASLMRKYRVTSQGLQSLFNKMVKAGVVTRAEIEERAPVTERTVELGLYICPACGNIHNSEFTECEQCGFSTPTYMQPQRDSGRKRRPPATPTRERLTQRLAPKSKTEPAPELSQQVPEPEEPPPAAEMPRSSLTRIDKIVKQCRLLSIAALASYVVVIVGLFLLWAIFPQDGSITLIQVLVAIFVVQLPALVLILTTVVNLRALAEYTKVFATSGSPINRSEKQLGRPQGDPII